MAASNPTKKPTAKSSAPPKKAPPKPKGNVKLNSFDLIDACRRHGDRLDPENEVEDLQDLIHLFWDTLTPVQQHAVVASKLVQGIQDLAYESQAAITERFRDAVAACAAERYGVRLTPDQAAAVVLNNNYLKRQLCIIYGRRPPAGGFDTDERELIGQALLDYLMPGKPVNADTLLWASGAGKTWHWPLNGSSKDYVEEFGRRFGAAVTAAGAELIEEFWADPDPIKR